MDFPSCSTHKVPVVTSTSYIFKALLLNDRKRGPLSLNAFLVSSQSHFYSGWLLVGLSPWKWPFSIFLVDLNSGVGGSLPFQTVALWLHFSVPCEFTEPCPLSHQPVCKQTILWCLHLIAPTPAHTTAGVRYQCYPKRPERWCPIHLCRYCLVSCMACGKYLLRGNTVNKSWAWSQADLGSNPSSPFC